MLYDIEVNYEESYTVRVEAKSLQDAEEIVNTQLDLDGLEVHKDRDTNAREWHVWVDSNENQYTIQDS